MTNVGACQDWTDLAAVQAMPGMSGVADDVIEEAVGVATDLLYRLSGHRWPGICERTVRPVGKPVAGEPVWWPLQDSSLTLDSWWGYTQWQESWGSCRCNERRLTGMQSMAAVTLGVYPLLTVEAVMVDGAALAPGEYQVVDDRWLQRLPDTGGTSPRGWPCCQRLDLPDTAAGTWSVTFTYGGAPPPSGVSAAKQLAADLAAAWGGGDCVLDDRVTQVVREGLSMDLTGPEDGSQLLALPLVRAFLTAVNPQKLQRRARVVNPDSPRTTVRSSATTAGS